MKYTKSQIYLLATIVIIIVGFFLNRKYEEKKEVKILVDSFMASESLLRYNKFIERGIIKDSLNNFKGAIEDFTIASKILVDGKSDHLAYHLRGNSKNHINDYVGAIADFTKAIEIDSSYSISYLNRGYSKYLSNDKNGACLDWYKASELGPINVSTTSNDLIKKYCN